MAGILRDNLVVEGYEAITAADGVSAVDTALKRNPDCIILDVMLPGKNGFEVCRELRARGFARPILMLTAKSDEIDKVRGLELGADDYVTKPFGVQELLARIRVALRRPASAAAVATIRLGETEVDLRKWKVRRGRKEIALTTYEARLLELLAQKPGQVFARDEILNRVWGLDATPTNRTVDNFVARLRKKIEVNPSRPRHLLTIHGAGYKLEVDS